jgi:hypothetical protein
MFGRITHTILFSSFSPRPDARASPLLLSPLDAERLERGHWARVYPPAHSHPLGHTPLPSSVPTNTPGIENARTDTRPASAGYGGFARSSSLKLALKIARAKGWHTSDAYTVHVHWRSVQTGAVVRALHGRSCRKARRLEAGREDDLDELDLEDLDRYFPVVDLGETWGKEVELGRDA